MQWIGNNLIDDKNQHVVGCDESESCCAMNEIRVYDNNNNDITCWDLTDWEFAEFPKINDERGHDITEITIINRKLNVTGKVVLNRDDNDSPNYWSEKMEQENGK